MKAILKQTPNAITVKNVSKTFRIPHERIMTMRGAFVNILKKKTYETFNALDNVSFTVKKGEFFGIVGRNGSGKSTLLKMLAGIYTPGSGTIDVDGLISPFLELGIGFNPELSGRDNIFLNGTVLGLSRKQIQERFQKIVAFSELERFIDQKIKNYSSGMQVRLAFSVAIHANRDILLMDEVLAVGDVNFQKKCLDVFQDFKKKGKTIILVTHDLSTVLNFCDRAMLIENGKKIIEGDVYEVIQRYTLSNIDFLEQKAQEQPVEATASPAPEPVPEEQPAKEEAEKPQETAKQTVEQPAEAIPEEAPKKQEKPKRWGTGETRISRVELFEGDKKKDKHVIQSNSAVTFRVHLDVKKPLEQLILGLGIHLQDNDQYCFALNSALDKVKITPEQQQKGYVDISIPELLLNDGQYYVNAIVCNKILSFNQAVDFIGKIKQFTVRNIKLNEGLFQQEHTWK